MPLAIEHVDVDDAIEIYDCTLCLVRPDGHVAWRGNDDPVNASAIIDAVRGAGASGFRTNADAFADSGRSAA